MTPDEKLAEVMDPCAHEWQAQYVQEPDRTTELLYCGKCGIVDSRVINGATQEPGTTQEKQDGPA